MSAAATPARPHIADQARVLHPQYGRGTVVSVDRAHGYAGVLFDGERAVRHVPMHRLAVARAVVPPPAPYRVIWPCAEGEVV